MQPILDSYLYISQDFTSFFTGSFLSKFMDTGLITIKSCSFVMDPNFFVIVTLRKYLVVTECLPHLHSVPFIRFELLFHVVKREV